MSVAATLDPVADTGRMPLSRRAMVLGAGTLVIAGCTAPGSTNPTTAGPMTSSPPSWSLATPTPTPTTTPTPTPSSAASVTETLPTPTPWTADANEIQGAVKLVATRFVEALGTWDPSTAGTAAARARVSALGIDPAYVAAASGLLSGGRAARLQVVDAQYGGLLSSTASVLVPTRQWLIDEAGAVTERGWTFDIRLSAASPTWRITAVNPSDPGPAVAVGGLAAQVLGSSRIELPPASRADIASGQVHDSVLQAMLSLARTYALGISVIRSGHPTYVFGTTRMSDHPKGRAFDTWKINGLPVVAGSTPRSLVTGYMTTVAGLGSYNVGGPYLLNGSAYFSDQTHHDHVHAGFTA